MRDAFRHALFAFIILSDLCNSGTTVCVSRWWEGRGFGWEAEKARSQKNACKSGRIPPVGCTLC
jgi:hypothetical protein